MIDWTPTRLLALRMRLGLSQQSAAERVGVALTTWWRWERGDTVPRDYDTVTRLIALDHEPQGEPPDDL
jgi:transcriptional regulator with XRE-family HTH domain